MRSGGANVSVSTEWLRSDLREIERHPDKALALTQKIDRQLSAMRQAAVDLEKPRGEESTDAARNDLGKIFQRKEFRGLSGPSSTELALARMSRWLAGKIVGLLSRLHIGQASGNILAWSTIALAFFALCYMVWKWLSRISRTPEADTDAPVLPADAREWMREALGAAERGDYREAIHCAYWAAVSRLEDLRLLTRDRARTPRESLRLLTTHPTEQKLLGELTRHFELIWYGYRPASAADWSGAREHLEKIGCLNPSTAATASS